MPPALPGDLLLNLPARGREENLFTAWEHGDIELELEVLCREAPTPVSTCRVATRYSSSTAGASATPHLPTSAGSISVGPQPAPGPPRLRGTPASGERQPGARPLADLPHPVPCAPLRCGGAEGGERALRARGPQRSGDPRERRARRPYPIGCLRGRTAAGPADAPGRPRPGGVPQHPLQTLHRRAAWPLQPPVPGV